MFESRVIAFVGLLQPSTRRSAWLATSPKFQPPRGLHLKGLLAEGRQDCSHKSQTLMTDPTGQRHFPTSRSHHCFYQRFRRDRACRVMNDCADHVAAVRPRMMSFATIDPIWFSYAESFLPSRSSLSRSQRSSHSTQFSSLNRFSISGRLFF